MSGKTILLMFCFSLIFTFKIFSQNLIFNPSFEINEGIPDFIGQWNLVTGWNNVNGDLGPFPAPSPDYLHILSSDQFVGLPNSILGEVSPYEGEAIMGITCWTLATENFREYLSQKLSSPLTVGKNYQISFYITNGIQMQSNTGGYGISDFGIHLSVDSLLQVNSEPIELDPLFSIDTVFYSALWQQVSFSFIATLPYEYITIGNFNDEDDTAPVFFNETSGPAAYYFLDYFFLEELPPEINVVGTEQICQGETVELIASGDDIIGWATEENPDFIINTTNTFEVSLDTPTTFIIYGSQDTTSWFVDVIETPIINLGLDTTICENTELVLDAFYTNASYEWQDGDTSSMFIVNSEGTYTVFLELEDCSYSDEITIIEEECPCIYQIPNAFTPDGDGVNDAFGPVFNCEEEILFHLKVFNRWGQLVFDQTGQNVFWDGTFNGKASPSDVYVYIIYEIRSDTENSVRKGDVTLIR